LGLVMVHGSLLVISARTLTLHYLQSIVPMGK
jgi:hypothetical protein